MLGLGKARFRWRPGLFTARTLPIIPGACSDGDESLASAVPDPWAFIVTVASPGPGDLSLMFGSLLCFSAEELETTLL